MKFLVIGLLCLLICAVAAQDSEEDSTILYTESEADEFEPLPIAGFTYESGIYALSTVVKVNSQYICLKIIPYSSNSAAQLVPSTCCLCCAELWLGQCAHTEFRAEIIQFPSHIGSDEFAYRTYLDIWRKLGCQHPVELVQYWWSF